MLFYYVKRHNCRDDLKSFASIVNRILCHSFYFVMVDLSHVERERSTSKVVNKIVLSHLIVNDGIRVAMLEATVSH